ncbi:MAG: 23S rRNA (adenine(2030)-N(6))-methyltransferase RlmJ [Legionellaceae bacterium]
MLSYQHGYHAGNFADVVKHFTLVHVLRHLTQKDKPFFYLETHAGRGLYDLYQPQGLKTQESTHGIRLVWDQRASLPKIFDDYVNIINHINPQNTLRFYPGSPLIAHSLLRDNDRSLYCEMHPTEFQYLENMPYRRKKGRVFEGDGLLNMKSTLPPQERRGLIFIDPSYEVKTDYRLLPELLKDAYARFETGIYCVWYPLIDKKINEKFKRSLLNVGAKSFLSLEFMLEPVFKAQGMKGCGLFIINPPYLLASQLKEGMHVLCRLLNPGVSTFILDAHVK